MSRFFAAIVGAFVEAWAELRIHRTRVLLSLIGVAVAVAAITAVVGVAGIAEQAQREAYEQAGRPATLYVSAYNDSGEMDAAAFSEAFDTAIDRYKIEYSSRSGYAASDVQFPDGASEVQIITTDVDAAIIHRTIVDQGAWFTAADEKRLAPAVILNYTMWERIGSPDLRTHPTIEMLGEGNSKTVAVVVGVMPKQQWEEDYFEMRMLYSAWERTATPDMLAQSTPQYEVWIPPDMSDQLTELLRRDIAGALGEGTTVDIGRMDFEGQQGGDDPLLPFKLVVGGVAALVLFLGALSLVNISLVTVKQRIREIGIRRSFGATAGRVFFAVMMESIVGTLVAGIVGVVVAVFVVTNPWILEQVSGGNLQDIPPFPIEAAILGLIASVAVGALAGLLPALVAVRVKVIDAIRY